MDNSGTDRDAGAGEAAAARDHRWGPDRRLPWISLALALAAIAWRLVSHDAENRLVALALAAVFLVLAILLLRVRVRLAADPRGLAVYGPVTRRFIAWPDVVSIAAPRRGRFGRRAATLEIEFRAGDPEPQLAAFSGFELGADPADVADALQLLRP